MFGKLVIAHQRTSGENYSSGKYPRKLGTGETHVVHG